MRKIWWIIAIVVIGGAAVYWFVFREKKQTVQWRTAKIEPGDLKVTVTATGTLSAVTTVQVGTQVSGTISKLNVDFNSKVKKGQVIAQLDPLLLDAAVLDAKATLTKAILAQQQAKRDLDRTKALALKQYAPQADLDLAQSTYDSDSAAVISARAGLNRAKINLQYATITAPIDGVVIQRNVDIGQTVAASFNTPTLFSIANDLTKMQVQASIDEADIGQVEVGQLVNFTVDAYPGQVFKGNVTQIRLQPNISASVVTYTVIVNVPNDDLKLMPGMTANITVNVTQHDNVLKVPSTALRFTPSPEYIVPNVDSSQIVVSGTKGHKGGNGARDAKKQNGGNAQGGKNIKTGSDTSSTGIRPKYATLWLKAGDKLRPVKVRTGLTDGLNTEISGDIKAGDEAVLGMISSTGSAAGAQQQSPFSPARPGGGRRGGI